MSSLHLLQKLSRVFKSIMMNTLITLVDLKIENHICYIFELTYEFLHLYYLISFTLHDKF